MGGVCCRPTPVDFDGDVTLFHFVLLRCVGKGAFGKVRVVQHKQTRELYALKYINKAKCVKMKAVPNVIQERRLLEEIDHPFIVNLRYAFQDDENCFFVLDLMLGGDLRYVVRFYVAQLSSCRAVLHDNNIMHRSILLDERGNAHLTDFNIGLKILTKRGIAITIDWWSLGVCAYETHLWTSAVPRTKNSDLTYSITKDPLKWHGGCGKRSVAGQEWQVLKGLLDRDPSRRSAVSQMARAIRKLRRHPWFKTIDWDTLESKEQTPHSSPDGKKANFDASHELEELLFRGQPTQSQDPQSQSREFFSGDAANGGTPLPRFTSYDFKKMQRRSYFPHNQLISTATATSSGMASSRPGTPANDLRMENGVAINGNSMDLHGGDPDAMRAERMIMTEKDYQ
ncbi:kinase-like domain-containing protein [Mycena latifolia]|nr:kinase-like domain-containing protein [Mycena latifolia]